MKIPSNHYLHNPVGKFNQKQTKVNQKLLNLIFDVDFRILIKQSKKKHIMYSCIFMYFIPCTDIKAKDIERHA